MRSILMTAVLAAASATLFAQTAPVKMGLWEKTIVSSVGEGSPTTVTDQSCITTQLWQHMLANAQKPHDGCKMNQVKTANSITFDGICSIPQESPMQIKGSLTITDPEHIVSESHSIADMNGKPHKIEVHSTSRFLSANCGSVKPDDE